MHGNPDPKLEGGTARQTFVATTIMFLLFIRIVIINFPNDNDNPDEEWNTDGDSKLSTHRLVSFNNTYTWGSRLRSIISRVTPVFFQSSQILYIFKARVMKPY